MMLDHDHRLPCLDEAVEQPEQVVDVGEVQPARRLVEHVDPALLRHLNGQLEPLSLTAGERGEGLAHAEVAEPDGGMRSRIVCAAAPRLTLGEELLGLGDRHREHLGDVLAAQLVFEHLGLKPLALAHLAERLDGVHEPQLGVDHAAPLHVGHAPSELALNRAGLTPFAFANALRIASSMPV